jgi:hypothetical protein
MDSKGYWHSESGEEEARRLEKVMAGLKDDGVRPAQRERHVIEFSKGEVATVKLADGRTITTTFESAEKNRVTLIPDDRQPYAEFAEAVTLLNECGQEARAQVWDNRSGRLILRTLPV